VVTGPAAHVVKQEIARGAEVTVTRNNKVAVDADAVRGIAALLQDLKLRLQADFEAVRSDGVRHAPSHRQNRKPIE
jgi:hypothetical protein